MECLLFFTLGGTEWLVILFALLLLFGGRKIPELMRGLGNGIREFNSAKDANLREPERRKIDSKVEDSNNR